MSDEPDVVAEVSVVAEAPTAAVWEALTDPDLAQRYTLGGARIETDWQVGSPITWTGEWNGKTFEDRGEILQVEPERVLSYSHWSPMGGTDDSPDNYHVVTIRLGDADGGTEVTLTQTNLTGGVTDEDRAHREEFEANWSTMLDGLREVVEE